MNTMARPLLRIAIAVVMACNGSSAPNATVQLAPPPNPASTAVPASAGFLEREHESPLSTDETFGFRDQVLVPGGTRDAADLVKNFLGREYDFTAYGSYLNAR